jgi:hypothetical protein
MGVLGIPLDPVRLRLGQRSSGYPSENPLLSRILVSRLRGNDVVENWESISAQLFRPVERVSLRDPTEHPHNLPDQFARDADEPTDLKA